MIQEISPVLSPTEVELHLAVVTVSPCGHLPGLNALMKRQMTMPLVSEAAVMWAGKE